MEEHKCNKKAIIFETTDGRKHLFDDDNALVRNTWYRNNYERVILAKRACSICNIASIDKIIKY